jgi:hypothetical protein
MVRIGLGALWVGVAVCTAAEGGRTVHEIVLLVRDAAQAKTPDGKVAKELRKFQLAEHVDDHLIEELVSSGAGPKTEEELDKLRDLTAGLPQPDLSADFPHGAPPTIPQQQSIVNAARDRALDYTHSLPDFFCDEIVQRYESYRGNWEMKDTLDIKLTYFEQKEKYDLLRINGRPTMRSFESVGGAQSQGEFGSLLGSLFAGDSGTRFRWDHWTTLRGRPAHVFQFRILATHSSYRIAFRTGNGSLTSTVTGQHGFVYIDRDTSSVLRIIGDADSIPRDFPVRMAHTVLDFGFTDVGGKEFLLPLRADVRMGTGYLLTRNDMEFRGYRKFGSEATVTFR